MTCEEAIKRLRQESCPATYNPDFDKEECLRTLEFELRELRRENAIIRKAAKKSEGALRALKLLFEGSDLTAAVQLKEAEGKSGEKEYWFYIGERIGANTVAIFDRELGEAVKEWLGR